MRLKNLKNLILSKLQLTISAEEIYSEWLKNDKPIPVPHIVKQKAIGSYKNEYGIDIFVETGTYLGDMVQAQLSQFKKIISIELGEKLYKKARKRFRKYNHVEILQGDSGVKLKGVVANLDACAVFWLDGHYSGGITAQGNLNCPIYAELDAIFSRGDLDHVILIDDARHFVGAEDYPTIEELKKYVNDKRVGYDCLVQDDIIRFSMQKQKR